MEKFGDIGPRGNKRWWSGGVTMNPEGARISLRSPGSVEPRSSFNDSTTGRAGNLRDSHGIEEVHHSLFLTLRQQLGVVYVLTAELTLVIDELD
jgi:hypothetical protein